MINLATQNKPTFPLNCQDDEVFLPMEEQPAAAACGTEQTDDIHSVKLKSYNMTRLRYKSTLMGIYTTKY
jgi:hypothetical protein